MTRLKIGRIDGTPLSPAEKAILDKLMEPDRGFPERVVEEIAAELDQDPSETQAILEKLEGEGVTQSEVDAKLDQRIWIAVNEGAERLDPPER